MTPPNPSATIEYHPLCLSDSAAKTVTVHVEGGMVADVAGIPAGTSVRVADHDDGDTSHPWWDADKGCLLTVYGGEEA